MRKKPDPQKSGQLLDDFKLNVLPWCEENRLSLHQAFELSREEDSEKYRILSGLWATRVGKIYLRSLFQSRGGVARPRCTEIEKE